MPHQITYKNRFVDIKTSAVLPILVLLVDAIAKQNVVWGDDAIDRWSFEIRHFFPGGIDLYLDELLDGDESREMEFLTMLDIVRDRIVKFGEIVPKEIVNRVTGPDALGLESATRDFPSGPILTGIDHIKNVVVGS